MAAPASSRTPKRISIAREEWEARLAEVHVDKDDLNRLVMDYLVIEGYREAAENFARESGLPPPVDLESIENRMDIRSAVQRGEVEAAVALVNELNPEILDTNPALLFSLQQQRMIEYIRKGEVAEALVFAQQELAPRGEENPAYLAELERTMALLAFDAFLPPTASAPAAKSDKDAPAPIPRYIHELLHPAQRYRTASQLNAAILTSQGHGKDAKLPALLRMMEWGEGMLEQKADFPKLDLKALLSQDSGRQGWSGAAPKEDTVMSEA